ncbi:MAG: hypothetical protein ACLTTW_05940 [Coprobacter sp.]
MSDSKVYFDDQVTFAIGGNDVKKEGDDAETKAVSIRELARCREGGIAPDYFLDKMDFIEAESL